MSRVAHWSSPAFELELRAWVEGALGPARLECHKVRPWSAVWRAYVERGTFWAKQNCPANRFEAALVEALARWQPDRFVPLTAVDTARGLMLTPDQGETLGFERRDVETWCRLVQEWGQVQRELVPHAAELVDLGVPAWTSRHPSSWRTSGPRSWRPSRWRIPAG